MAKMNALDWTALVLVLVGALNWGLVALQWNLVEALFGAGALTRIVYGAVGIAALYSIYSLYKARK
jgi:uncharacterized membrane protein YuzA (DUF378 family)